ncbi:MAG: NrfD/PsrC family molybdoenzyme membrane anchor subunit [Anaerolineae bacterium]
MTNYGFVIDQRTCIGCHACSVACKMENEVPLGVYRTWVKYVETGAFPNTRRHFQVTRCNHCANPPCVRICPVTAMYQRADGIVEFDPAVCIGCKACLQACPYDAVYMDPDTHSAAKCHYCAHRTDIGLEPACVIVCPTRSIIAGDLDDPNSAISRMVAREAVSVRKPEQGTAPKVFYVDGDDVTMTPTVPHTYDTFMWADIVTDQAKSLTSTPSPTGRGSQTQEKDGSPHAPNGTAIRAPQAQGLGVSGSALLMGGRVAEGMVQTAYNAQHKIPWHWPVPAYLVTKAIASGLYLLLAVVVGFGLTQSAPLFPIPVLTVALVFLAATAALLIFDLKKPRMFVTILTRPQWRSWLARGAFILLGFGVVAALWLIVAFAGAIGWIRPDIDLLIQWGLAWLGVPLAVLGAVYTAFLFAQAEGRDLWQSSALPLHFLVQAVMAGAAGLLVMAAIIAMPQGLLPFLVNVLVVSLFLDLLLTLMGEHGIPHASETAARAAEAIRTGRYAGWFWGGNIGVGHIVAMLLLAAALLLPRFGIPLAALSGLAVIVGLYAAEYAFVMAPQEIPNS